MPLNVTEAEQEKIVKRDLAEKIALEVILIRQLAELFDQIGTDVGNVVAATGNIPNMQLYQPEVEGILAPAYRRAAGVFGFDIDDELERQGEDDVLWQLLVAAAVIKGTTATEEFASFQAEKAVRLRAFINQQVPLSTGFIISTTQNIANTAFADAVIEAAQSQRIISDNGIGRMSREIFDEKSKPRPDLIAVTEIQNAAEGAKLIAVTTFQDVTEGVLDIELVIRKIWKDVDDAFVRAAHSLADGQVRNINEPFIVGGERMMRPRDTSLGASVGNISQCRCSCIYVMEGESLS